MQLAINYQNWCIFMHAYRSVSIKFHVLRTFSGFFSKLHAVTSACIKQKTMLAYMSYPLILHNIIMLSRNCPQLQLPHCRSELDRSISQLNHAYVYPEHVNVVLECQSSLKQQVTHQEDTVLSVKSYFNFLVLTHCKKACSHHLLTCDS